MACFEVMIIFHFCFSSYPEHWGPSILIIHSPGRGPDHEPSRALE